MRRVWIYCLSPYIWMTKKHMEKCSTPLVIWEITQWDTSSKIYNHKCWQGGEETELSYIASGNIKWYWHSQNSLAVFQNMIHRVTM